MAPRMFARTTYQWPFLTGPAYGEVEPARWSEPGVLHTRVGSFDLRHGTPAFPAALRAGATSRYAVLLVEPSSYADGRFDRLHRLLEERGGALVEAMAVGGHLIRLTPGAQGLLRAQPGVLALEPYHPAFKLSPLIGRVPLENAARATSTVYALEAVLFPGEDAGAVAASLTEVGATLTRVDPDVVFFEIDRDRLADVARIDAVKAMFETLPNLPQGEETTVAMQTGMWGNGASPFHDAGILGDGQILMVLDSGVQLDAAELSDTRTSAGTAGPAHRKVLLYTTAVGGTGDALGCDTSPQGGFTHGHVVAATALGNATSVAAGYGAGWLATDIHGGRWKLDGVAPRARLVFYDAQVTATTLSCADPESGGLSVGTLYVNDTPGAGSLGDAHGRGARVFNFSWGTVGANQYGTNAQRIDQFLFDHPDAALFVSAGNAGKDSNGDLVPDPMTIADPATCKSCIVVGASGNVDDPEDGTDDGYTFYNQRSRSFYSGVGPVGATSRVAPLLMAPGRDFGSPGNNMGIDSEYACRSSDNDQNDPVECDLVEDLSSTSYAAAAASGAALLVRDYFQQGFYPDGTSANPGNAADQVSVISGALLKAVLVTSADFMDGTRGSLPWWYGSGNLSQRFRFNREQGYGRIELGNALPLSTYAASPTGMIVVDGGLASGGRLDIPGLPGSIASAGTTQTGAIRVDGSQRELRCTLTWAEDASDALAHDLDLELVSPSGKVYFGNFFTEDVNGNGALDAGENCHDRGFPNYLDEEPWSIETNGCGAVAGSRRDTRNPVEAVFLSPDPAGDGVAAGSDNQIEVGDWTIKVVYRTGTGSQRYAVSCSGPLATGSSVRFDGTAYACVDQVRVIVQESTDPTDIGVTALNVSSRTTVEVLDGSGAVRDSEGGLAFTASGLRFESTKIALTDGTAYDPGNGVLDVRHGDRLRIFYADETGGLPDPNRLRVNTAAVDCKAHLSLDGVVWAQFGKDAATLVRGGCERDARGLFTFGFPDKFMDAGERISYRFGFKSLEAEELRDFEATLRCVEADADSPADCPPGSTACPDPDRLNNAPCTEMTILDSPQRVAVVPAGRAVSVNFNLEMAGSIAGTPKVDMLLGIQAEQRGRTVESLLASRHVLDADEVATFYSTDFPTGGTEYRDFNGNETLQNPTTDIFPDKDYLFETRTYGDLTAGGTKNTSLLAPWSFDVDDGGFRVGLNQASSNLGFQVVANWGEDKNFNGVLDPGEDRDPLNAVLDKGWSTKGGCGWQTKGSGVTGGIWHTGTIDLTTLVCSQQCETTDVLVGTSGTLEHWDTLVTPVVQKVNTSLDADGDPTHRLEITNWAWNMAVDLRTELDVLTWELDTDVASVTRADLYRDQTVTNSLQGNHGVLAAGTASLTGGFPVFSPFSGTASVNGTAGNNRAGKNPCLFENAGTAGRQLASTHSFAKPEDRSDGIATNGLGDQDDDGDTLIDEFVTDSGPIRNFDVSQVNGPDLRFTTLDDIYGSAGNSFQGALGFRVLEGISSIQPISGYGVGVDDMVIEWREVALVKDATGCAGACATLSLDVTNGYDGTGTLTVTVLDASPWDPLNSKNDCNGDGDYVDVLDDQDCDDDGLLDVVVRASSPGELTGEVFTLDRVSPGGAQWRGEVPFSTFINLPNSIYLIAPSASLPQVAETAQITVRYEDRDDGTGQRCGNTSDATTTGFLEESTTVFLDPPAHVVVRDVRLTDNGDNDGFADPNETVSMFLTLRNGSGSDRDGLTIRVSSNDPTVDCILSPVALFGSLANQESREATVPVVFRVAGVTRSSATADLTVTFNITIAGDDFDLSSWPQTVVLDLDLNVSGGLFPTSYTEGFESAGFGTFSTMSLDAGKEGSNTASDGFRCQYNDPDFPNSNSRGNTFCFLGAQTAPQNAFDWHVHTTAAPDGGRAYLGNNSLHWGMHPGAASADTTRLRQLDAIRTTVPVNLGWNGVRSELSFKHQVGLMDCDYLDCDGGGIDRGVVYVELASSSGAGVGRWQKISPYQNLYDSQTTDNYTNCLFDPTDDGNTEDDYFDPTDPLRRLGPSSTCMPEFAFTREGAIAFDSIFHSTSIGHASDGPGLQGVRGPGTWVETKFSLARYRGRRIRIRFLATSIEVSNAISAQQALGWNPIEADDGWYIDDVRVTNTLTSAATITVDTADRTGLPTCGLVCGSVAPVLGATPMTTGAPGQVTQLDASPSSADRCVGGILQFRFWRGSVGDVLLRTWTDNPVLVDAPDVTTSYAVEVRCSSLPTCNASQTVSVTVPCPSTGTAIELFGPSLGFASKTQLAWGSSTLVDVVRGDLGALRAGGGQFDGTVEACLANDALASSVVDATTPGLGVGMYYLVRGAGPSAYCNATPSWSTGSAAERPGAAGNRDDDLALDPDTCP